MVKDTTASALLEFVEAMNNNIALITALAAKSGNDLVLTAATGKDIKFKLTDAAGQRGFYIYDSGDVAVFSTDSDGNVTATKVTASFVGDIQYNDDATHDYGAAHADWTLSATEKKARTLIVTNADAAANIIVPAEKREYFLRNASGQAITVKKSGGTGVAVANGKTAIVKYSNSVGDVIRVTADATH